jgi:hypothetical protein
MASNTKASENKRKRRHKNMGRKRKAQQSKKSTPSAAELFAGFGEPGQPVTK